MIIIVDYGMGNLGSVANMLKKIGSQAMISSDPKIIERADKLILPGVGAFDHGMRNLESRQLIDVLNRCVLQNGIPLLGLCLGMQLLGESSEEGNLPGLCWLPAKSVRFRFKDNLTGLKVPHMAWNNVQATRFHPVLNGLETDNRFYFVHSYHVICRDESNVIGQTTYGLDFTSIMGSENILGVQFHPEKSHRFGMQLLSNFVQWENL